MGFSLSNMFDPAGMFSGDKGDIFGALIDPGGATMENFGFDSDWRGVDYDDASNWADDLADTTELLAKSRSRNVNRENMSGNMFKRDALTGFTGFGGSPIGTRFTNKIGGDDDRPLWDMYGGSTPDDYQYVQQKGQDPSNQQGLTAVGNTIGKGFINAFTYGLGSTALDALNSYGYGDEQSAKKIAQNGAKNWALNQILTSGMDYGGEAIGNSGGYYEQGGGYVGNNEYGGTGGFSLGKELGAGEYTPVVNSAAKGAVTNTAASAANGGNTQENLQAGLMGGIKGAANGGGGEMAMGYLGGLFGDMPDVGTIGGTMQDEYGENSATTGGQTSQIQSNANQQVMAMDRGYNLPQERSASVQSAPQGGFSPAVQAFLGAYNGTGGQTQGLGLADYGDMLGSLYGLYNARKQRNAYKDQLGQLQSLFSPDSPYAQMARQKMERRDAAAGRRSQYGPREVQLAALLADRQAQTFPQQAQYQNAIGGLDNMTVNNGLQFGRQLGKNANGIGTDLGNLFRYFNGGN